MSGAIRPLCKAFLQHLERRAPAFAYSVVETARRRPDLFSELGEPMLRRARRLLGEPCYDRLVDGYVAFVTDVNRSQVEYEIRGAYRHSSFAEVSSETYENDEFMRDYHWGVYVTTFAWEHHLLLYEFFRSHFMARVSARRPGPRLLDLGCGSGVWSIIALDHLENATSVMVDISSASINFTRKFLAVNGLTDQTTTIQHDALTFRMEEKADAAMSCFLLEHLERPERLFQSLSHALPERGFAFVTGALTAAEVDHIFEFRREGELVDMAEQAGFRVIATYSSAPEAVREKSAFLPRSMALVLQKRRNEVW